MKTLTTAELNRLEEALLDAFPGVVELDRLLRSDPPDKRFDDLASKYEPLRDAVVKIVFTAGDQGWALQLLEVAIARRPDNAALRTLHEASTTLSAPRTPADRGLRRERHDRRSARPLRELSSARSTVARAPTRTLRETHERTACPSRS